jgi:membrane protein DedA with SNARE-associated domain
MAGNFPRNHASAAWSAIRSRRRWTLATVGAVCLLLALFAVWEGDLPEAFGAGAHAIGHLLRRFGPVAAFILLYLEESGVPMPMPGDVFVMYVGHHNAGRLLSMLAAWLGLIAVVLLGATNLYFIARRWGRSIVERHLGKLLDLTPSRLESAERWFARWGVWTLIIGRHIPGLRVPLTLAAGIFRVPYPVFAASVAISTAVWAAFFMAIGITIGPRVGHLLQVHREGYVILPLILMLGFAVYLAVVIRRTRQADTTR